MEYSNSSHHHICILTKWQKKKSLVIVSAESYIERLVTVGSEGRTRRVLGEHQYFVKCQ